MKTEFLQMIKTRRSCRKYKAEQITDEELKAVLEAGTYAPTSRGMQAPYIVAVQNESQRRQLAEMNARVMGVTFRITMPPRMCWYLFRATLTTPYKTVVACLKI